MRTPSLNIAALALLLFAVASCSDGGDPVPDVSDGDSDASGEVEPSDLGDAQDDDAADQPELPGNDETIDTPGDTPGDVPNDVSHDEPDTDGDPPPDADAGADDGDDDDEGGAARFCGNGILDPGEECDDGNRTDDDGCRNDCTESFCGDGLINESYSMVSFESPIVRDLGGVAGYVCDDGGSCPAGSGPVRCFPEDDPTAPEHGICQSLGFPRAAEVIWGSGLGAGTTPLLHAFNWECNGYVCELSPFADYSPNCVQSEMLDLLVCDGVIREECDDGDSNADVPDACRTNCRLPACGDGIVDSDEECDSGDRNADVPNLCRTNCRVPACGDGIVDSGEECDDGALNGTAPDACRPDCRLPSCGDGVVDAGEECDDGNDVATDGCSNNCRFPGCGDGVLQPELGEECDDGNDVDDDGCSGRCLLPQCGDGIVQAEMGEECDDGNDIDTDLCRNGCRLPRCGDGFVSYRFATDVLSGQPVTGPTGARGHVCDAGGSCTGSLTGNTCNVATNSSAPEHGICQALGYERALSVTWGGGPGDADVEMPHAFNWLCRDFVCEPSANTYDRDNCGPRNMLQSIECFGALVEQCDAGPLNADVPGAPCRTDCTLPRCGDGVVEDGEECDDGNDIDDDGCSNECRLPICGDGVVQGDEECDDGNDIDDDDCRNDCTLPVCGDGFLALSEECDDGPDNSDEPDASCRPDCTNPRCGDGVVDTGEECDEGAANANTPGATCRPNCRAARCGDGVVDPDEECDDGPLNSDAADTTCRLDCTAPGEGD